MPSRTALLFLAAALTFLPSAAFAAGHASGCEESVNSFVVHHVADQKEAWHALPAVGAFPGLTIPLKPDFALAGFNMPITAHVAMLFIAAALLFVLFAFVYRKRSDRAPSGLTNLLEAMVVFVRDDICVAYMGKKDGRRLAPLFLTFFFFILALNLLGLIPFFTTATSNFNVTGGLAAVTLLLMVGGGIVRNGPLGFAKIFFPPGIPWPIYVLITPIEFLGLFIKSVALTIRLGANLMAGHIVIYSLLTLIYKLEWVGTIFIAMVVFVYVLEILVAFLQAYIFTMLSALFTGQMLHPSH